MQVQLDYGEHGLPFRIPPGFRGRVEVIRPRFPPPLPDPDAALAAALRNPLAGPPLAGIVPGDASVAVSVCDPTRPQPRVAMLRALLAEIGRPGRVTILVATGTHRAPTSAELESMLGADLLASCAVVIHDCRDRSALTRLPDTPNGVPVLLNRTFLEADVRITTGFVEPHFFAGFSGGPKMVAPGLAGLETILTLHDSARVGHPNSVFGIVEGNPIHDDVRDIAARVGVDFALDVLLDGEKRISGVFAGSLAEEHAAACHRSREEAMCPVTAPFDVVVTTNSGFPLDQNLYQAVKGLEAAARVVRPGGLILCAAECREGVPDGSAYHRALSRGASVDEVAATLAAQPHTRPDDWQVQVHCRILERARVGLYSSLPAETVRGAHIEPVEDLEARCAEALAAAGPEASLAVLPHGPITIPYLPSTGTP